LEDILVEVKSICNDFDEVVPKTEPAGTTPIIQPIPKSKDEELMSEVEFLLGKINPEFKRSEQLQSENCIGQPFRTYQAAPP